jgi:hypothetical protein
LKTNLLKNTTPTLEKKLRQRYVRPFMLDPSMVGFLLVQFLVVRKHRNCRDQAAGDAGSVAARSTAERFWRLSTKKASLLMTKSQY